MAFCRDNRTRDSQNQGLRLHGGGAQCGVVNREGMHGVVEEDNVLLACCCVEPCRGG
ncbi:hypothetical protein AHAS_Ahas10G0035700 [Arachis hypogaea]